MEIGAKSTGRARVFGKSRYEKRAAGLSEKIAYGSLMRDSARHYRRRAGKRAI